MASAAVTAKPISFEFSTDQTPGNEKIWFKLENEEDAERYKALVADTGRAFTPLNPALNKTYTHVFLARGWANDSAKKFSPQQAMQKAMIAAARLMSKKTDETKAVQ